jgi:hypothetical protein
VDAPGAADPGAAHDRRVCHLKHLHADPAFAAANAARARAVMTRNHADPAFKAAVRARARARMKALNADPAFGAANAARGRARMKAQRADPAFQAALAAGRARRWGDPARNPLAALSPAQRRDYDTFRKAGYSRAEALDAVAAAAALAGVATGGAALGGVAPGGVALGGVAPGGAALAGRTPGTVLFDDWPDGMDGPGVTRSAGHGQGFEQGARMMGGSLARLANRWRAAEDAIVRRVYPAGGVEACGPLLPGRTRAAIKWRAGVLGVTQAFTSRGVFSDGGGGRDHPCSKPRAPIVRTRRRCLMCGNTFVSDGAGHRVCKACKATNAWRGGDVGGCHGFGRRGWVRGAGGQP